MDKQEYLNQISAHVAPPKKGLPNFLTSKIFWFIIGALLFAALIMIVGSAATSGRVTNEERVIELMLHVDNTNNAVNTYRYNVKSSALRSYSASLGTILSDISAKLNNYAVQVYEYNPKKPTPKIQTIMDNAALASQELNNELFTAKITGNLDNVYDLKMVYEISTIITQEEAILNSSDNPDLTNILAPSIDSLNTIYKNFDEYEVGISY